MILTHFASGANNRETNTAALFFRVYTETFRVAPESLLTSSNTIGENSLYSYQQGAGGVEQYGNLTAESAQKLHSLRLLHNKCHKLEVLCRRAAVIPHLHHFLVRFNVTGRDHLRIIYSNFTCTINNSNGLLKSKRFTDVLCINRICGE